FEPMHQRAAVRHCLTGIQCGWKLQMKREHLVGFQTGVGRSKPREALNQQAGCRNEYYGQCDLADDERRAYSCDSATGSAAARALLERSSQIRARCSKRRKCGQPSADRDTYSQHHEQYVFVDTHCFPSREKAEQVSRDILLDQSHSQFACKHAKYACSE